MPDVGEKRSRLRALVQDALRLLLGKEPTQPPDDPDAYTMAPIRHGPKGRSGAAAVDEPEEDSFRAFPPLRH